MHFLHLKGGRSDTEEVTIPLEDGGKETFSVERRDGNGLTAEMRKAFQAAETKRRHEKKIAS